MANELFHFHGVQAILTDLGLNCAAANRIASASQAVDDASKKRCYQQQQALAL